MTTATQQLRILAIGKQADNVCLLKAQIGEHVITFERHDFKFIVTVDGDRREYRRRWDALDEWYYRRCYYEGWEARRAGIPLDDIRLFPVNDAMRDGWTAHGPTDEERWQECMDVDDIGRDESLHPWRY